MNKPPKISHTSISYHIFFKQQKVRGKALHTEEAHPQKKRGAMYI